MGELALAGFHLLRHVGGEVIRESRRGAKLLGLKVTERVGTAAVGKATGDRRSQKPDSQAGLEGLEGQEARGGPCRVL